MMPISFYDRLDLDTAQYVYYGQARPICTEDNIGKNWEHLITSTVYLYVYMYTYKYIYIYIYIYIYVISMHVYERSLETPADTLCLWLAMGIYYSRNT